MKLPSAITLTAIITLIQGCGDGFSKTKGEFVTGCVQGGSSKAICSCIYDDFTKKHQPIELVKLANPNTEASDPVVVSFRAAIQHCRNE